MTPYLSRNRLAGRRFMRLSCILTRPEAAHRLENPNVNRTKSPCLPSRLSVQQGFLMSSAPNPFGTRQTFTAAGGRAATFYSIPRLEKEGVGPVSRLPVSLRVVLESLLRNLDGKRIKEDDVRALAAWKPTGERTAEIPFV